LYLDNSNNLLLDTSTTKILALYLEAASDNSTTNAYLPLFFTVSNFAPIFQNGDPELELKLFKKEELFTYNLPPYIDVEGDPVEVFFEDLEPWMTFSEQNNTIEFELDHSR
jgi:hypothetical protein